MVKNAEKFKEEDKKKREAIEVKNNLDNKIHSVEKTLSEHKDKLNQDVLGEVEGEIKKSKDALSSEDHD